jgi:hypothetical protein
MISFRQTPTYVKCFIDIIPDDGRRAIIQKTRFGYASYFFRVTVGEVFFAAYSEVASYSSKFLLT